MAHRFFGYNDSELYRCKILGAAYFFIFAAASFRFL